MSSCVALSHPSQSNDGAVLRSDPMRPHSSVRSLGWGVLALVAVLSPFLWLVAWPHGHPPTSWIAVSFLVLVGLLVVRRTQRGTDQSRRPGHRL
jgi:hypothetical protein